MASPSVKKNKRKSQEPRKLNTWPNQQQQPGVAAGHQPAAGQLPTTHSLGLLGLNTKSAPASVDILGKNAKASAKANDDDQPEDTEIQRLRSRLNSTGSEERSPTTTEYTSDSRTPSPLTAISNSTTTVNSRPDLSAALQISPTGKKKRVQPLNLAPKKRFKCDALRDLAETESGGAGTDPCGSPSSPDARTMFSPDRLPHAVPCLPFIVPAIIGDKILPFHRGLFPIPLAAMAGIPEQEEPLSLVVRDRREKEVEEEVPKAKDLTVVKHGSGKTGKTALSNKVTKSITKREPATDRKQKEKTLPPSSPELCLDERAKQRNYKNLTRERRVEANARERQRVHTITAAFDSLQAAIPVEEENAKLSKLSVIKIATAYIMALSRMAGHDYTEDQSAPSVSSVISHCQEVIHNEARVKKRGTSN